MDECLRSPALPRPALWAGQGGGDIRPLVDIRLQAAPRRLLRSPAQRAGKLPQPVQVKNRYQLALYSAS